MENLITWEEYTTYFSGEGFSDVEPPFFSRVQSIALTTLIKLCPQDHLIPLTLDELNSLKKEYQQQFKQALMEQIYYSTKADSNFNKSIGSAGGTVSVVNYSANTASTSQLKEILIQLSPKTEMILYSIGWMYASVTLLPKGNWYD